jgi:hypothetical protein
MGLPCQPDLSDILEEGDTLRCCSMGEMSSSCTRHQEIADGETGIPETSQEIQAWDKFPALEER